MSEIIMIDSSRISGVSPRKSCLCLSEDFNLEAESSRRGIMYSGETKCHVGLRRWVLIISPSSIALSTVLRFVP
jgi:hypothetical protein